jgi:hypothetical protein
LDVVLLALFCSAAEKNDDLLANFSEVHAVPKTEIDPALVNPGSDALTIGEIPESQAIDGGRDLARSLGVQPVKPIAKWAAAASIAILAEFVERWADYKHRKKERKED